MLVEVNPLAQVLTASDVHAVMQRGRWFGQEEREKLLARLRAIYAQRPEVVDPEKPVSTSWSDRFVADARELRERGYVFPTNHLQEMGVALRAMGREDAAARLPIH